MIRRITIPIMPDFASGAAWMIRDIDYQPQPIRYDRIDVEVDAYYMHPAFTAYYKCYEQSGEKPAYIILGYLDYLELCLLTSPQDGFNLIDKLYDVPIIELPATGRHIEAVAHKRLRGSKRAGPYKVDR